MSELKSLSTLRAIAVAVLAAAVVGAGGGWFLIVSPQRSKASKLETTIRDKQAAVAVAQHELSTAQNGSARLQVLDTALPAQPAMAQVVEQLNHLATQAGVTLDTVTPSTEVPGSGYEAVPLNVVVDGRYFGVERFLHLVRTQVKLGTSRVSAHGRLFDVQSIQLEQTEPAPTVSATLGLRAFYYSTTATPTPTTTTTAADATSTTTSAG
jgi:Tfp pilus assembly protein PilO